MTNIMKSLHALTLVTLFASCAAAPPTSLDHQTDTGDTAFDAEVSGKFFAAFFATSGYPEGMVCGISYSSNNASPTTVVNGSCAGHSTYGGKGASGYIIDLNDGDWGLKAGYGFAHQYYATSSAGVDDYTSAYLKLPQGTACGFKHSQNTKLLKCMGHDPKTSCPPGWTQRYAGDSKSSGGYFQWCEYQDPHSYCNTTSCFASMPSGLACGVMHAAEATGVGYCNNVKITSGCPSGFTREGYYDWGRKAGQGIGWCRKT